MLYKGHIESQNNDFNIIIRHHWPNLPVDDK